LPTTTGTEASTALEKWAISRENLDRPSRSHNPAMQTLERSIACDEGALGRRMTSRAPSAPLVVGNSGERGVREPASATAPVNTSSAADDARREAAHGRATRRRGDMTSDLDKLIANLSDSGRDRLRGALAADPELAHGLMIMTADLPTGTQERLLRRVAVHLERKGLGRGALVPALADVIHQALEREDA
jgi:hypothetical protein